MAYYMGYHYDEPKRGKGFCMTADFGHGKLTFDPITKGYATEVRRELLRNGYTKDDIKSERNR